MNLERHLTQPGPVLDENGSPIPGYSVKSVLRYDRNAIRTSKWRIKEWDFYQISDREKVLNFTLGHLSYGGQAAISLTNFYTGEKIFDKMVIIPLALDRMNMPADAERNGLHVYDKNGIKLSFRIQGSRRWLYCRWKDELEAQILLTRENPYSIAVNVPFPGEPRQFYYNHKINCMRASGFVRYRDRLFRFEPDSAFGLLDWGRGVWPFHNAWYWSNGTGIQDGELVGFNLGCGFGDTTYGSENIIFYRGGYHKLGQVTIEHQPIKTPNDYMRPWRLYDEAGRLDLTLTPMYDKTTKVLVFGVGMHCHQMFGNFNGHVILDDGGRLEIKDLTAFAEHSINNW